MTLDLEAIKARAEAEDDGTGSWVCGRCGKDGIAHGSGDAMHCLWDPLWITPQSSQDRLALVAEVERLQGLVDAALALADRWTACSRGFSGPPDDMPDEQTYYGVMTSNEFAHILRQPQSQDAGHSNGAAS